MKNLLLDLARAGFKIRWEMADYAFREGIIVTLTKHYNGQDYTQSRIVSSHEYENMVDLIFNTAEELKDLITREAGRSALTNQ